MREVRVHAFCDVCQAEVEDDATLTVAFGTNGAPRQLELCTVHMKEFYEPLLNLVLEHGQAMPTNGGAANGRAAKAVKPAETEQWTCPFCGKHLRPASSTSHLRMTHSAKPPKQPKRCPEEGCAFAHADGSRMLGHRARVHNYSTLDALIESVRQHGPAKRRKLDVEPLRQAFEKERPHCPQCGRDLVNRVQVMRHLQKVHGMDKVAASQAVPPTDPSNAATCGVCGFVTTLGPGLLKHIERDHPGVEYMSAAVSN